MPATMTISGQLKDIQAAAVAKRDEVAALRAERDRLKDEFIAAGVEPERIQDSPEFLAADKAREAHDEAHREYEAIRAAERGVLALIGGSDATDAVLDASAAFSNAWDVPRLAASEEFQELARHSASTGRFGTIRLFADDDRDTHKARNETAMLLAGRDGGRYLAAPVDSTNKVGAIPADRRGFVIPALRRLRITDLIPTGTTESNSIDYVQVTTAPGEAAETAELAAKPEANFVTADATAPVRTIAEWKKLSRQSVSDSGTLMAAIQSLLAFDVRRRMDAQIIAGSGTSPNLRGLLNTSGIGAPAFVAGDTKLMAVQRAITAVWAAEGDPDFVAVNPTVMQDFRFDKATTGEYIYGDPANPAPPMVWGIPLIVTTAVPATTVLVGDSTQASLLIREGLMVRVTDTDQDDFVTNRVTILAEMRAALLVWRPAAFAKGAFS